MKIVAMLDAGDTALWNKKVVRSYMITCAAQTRFLIKDNGQTRLPYISRIVFDNGIVISIEKLDPITYEKIP